MSDTSKGSGAGLRIVGGLAVLWNGFGALDYTMTKLHNAGWLTAMKVDPAMLAKVDAAPAWATAGWALGVWAAFAGSVLLLARRKAAANLFLASLVGAVISFAWQYAAGIMASLALPGVIVGVIVLLFWYTRRAEGQGLLS